MHYKFFSQHWTSPRLKATILLVTHNKIRPGWFQDGQPSGMERFHNGAYWEGEPRPVIARNPEAGKPTGFQNQRWWTTAGIAFIIVFAAINMSAADVVISGTVMLALSPFILVALVLGLLWRAGNKRTVVAQPAAAVSGFQPGWYPDMNDPTLKRWFDGQTWTAATLRR